MTISPAGMPCPGRVEEYLERTGWACTDKTPTETVWLSSDVQVVVSATPFGPAYAQATADAVRAIAFAERRPYADVLADIAAGGADSFAIRYVSDIADGLIPLPLAECVLIGLRGLVHAATERVNPTAAAVDRAMVGFDHDGLAARVTLPLDPVHVKGVVLAPTRQVTRRMWEAIQHVQHGRLSKVTTAELKALADLGGHAQHEYLARISVSPLVYDHGCARAVTQFTIEHQDRCANVIAARNREGELA